MEISRKEGRKVDVLVVGAGPAGCAAAKRCAEAGLETVLFEMKKLPRDKVCSGLIVSQLAQRLVRDTFGEIPLDVLANPYYYKGIIIYVVGAQPLTIENKIPVGWRRDIDFWMTQKAKQAGANIYDGRIVKHISVEKDYIEVRFLENGQEHSIKTSYVIGADGVRSQVRRALYPELRVRYQQEIREIYEGSFPLDREFFHAFYVPGQYWFDINHKGSNFCLEVSSKPGELKDRLTQTKKMLHKEFNFDPSSKPLRREACMEPRIHEQLIKGTFKPAKGRILLTGDAAGFQLPTSEGIGTALLSGLMAAESVIDSIKRGGLAEEMYLKKVSPIITTIAEQLVMAKNSRYKETNWNPEEIAEGIRALQMRAMFEDTF